MSTPRSPYCRSVYAACKLLWRNCLLGVLFLVAASVVDTFSDLGALNIVVGWVLVWAATIFFCVLTRWVTSRLEAGRRWMRLFVAAGLLTGVTAGQWMENAFLFAMTLTGVTTLVLLYSPSARLWFASRDVSPDNRMQRPELPSSANARSPMWAASRTSQKGLQ